MITIIAHDAADDEQHLQTEVELRSVLERHPIFRALSEKGGFIIVPDISVYPGWSDIPGLHLAHSYVGIPIFNQEHLIGFLNIGHETPGAYAHIQTSLFDLIRKYQTEIEKLIDAGLAETTEKSLRLTRKGKLFSNEVFSVFV